MSTYYELLEGVAQYYGSGSDQWAQIAKYGVTAETIPIIEQVPGVSTTVSESGKFLGFDYVKPFSSTPNPVSTINSNVQTGAYGAGSFNAQLPSTAVTDTSTGLTTMESGAKVVSTGSTLAAIADKTSLAIIGVSLGTKLGKLIDSGLYTANPEWWDEHYPTINPETWDDMASTQGGKTVIRSLFGLQNDDATMYVDERMLAYTYMTLLANGAYDDGGYDTDQSRVDTGYLRYPDTTYHIETGTYLDTLTYLEGVPTWRRQFWGDNCLLYAWAGSDPNGATVIIAVSDQPGAVLRSQEERIGSTPRDYTNQLESTFVRNGKTFYWAQSPIGTRDSTQSILYTFQRSYATSPNNRDDASVIAFLGSVEIPALPGVDVNPEAGEPVNKNALINPTTGEPVTANDNPADVLQALKNVYPDLFNNSIYEDVPQPDGTLNRITYIPVPYPNTTNPVQPITDTTQGIDPQKDPQINPDNRVEGLLQQLVDTLTTTTTPPDTGEGETPPAVIPSGSASALYSIYNPTQAELNSFGAWLWSSDFVDQLLKLFNDPMQAIIGLHKVFAPPAISGTSTIKVGYLNSGVSSNTVGAQYTTVDCGAVDIREYFGNVFDYDPFTQILLYLPFIGIVQLNTGDVMRGSIGVKYRVDVITGACLAEVSVTRDGGGGVLYTYSGDCAVQYPISSGSYMGIVASLASVAGGVVGTISSGGALAPLAMGAVSGVMNTHTRVNHSGGFSGNAGAMGIKKPYLIITRPQTCLADDFPDFNGYPANKTTTLSSCTGFIKCDECHINNIPATDTELSEIESLLKTGILL